MNTLSKTLFAFCLTAVSAISILPSNAKAQMSDAQALVQPFYDFLSGEVDAQAGFANMSDDWVSYYSNEGYKTAEETSKSITGLRTHNVHDLNWEIKEVIATDDRIIVRGEGSGTPTKDFFGVPHGGKSFSVMSIDIHQVADGTIVKTWHIEDWAGALKQLKSK